MNRLLATIRWDIQLQFRNGFYYASVFVALIWIALLTQAPGLDLNLLLPAFILGNLVMNTFYFIAGLVLLEKGEGTLEAQVVTPLRTWEYLASKVITLTLLSLVECLAIVSFSYGLGFRMIPLLLGITLLAVLYCLYGFVVVARYDSINEYLFPSVFYTTILSIPLLDYFGLVKSWLFYLHPIQAPLVLLQAAFQPVPSWQIVYGLAYAALWSALIYEMTRRAFYRFIVAREGVR